MTGYILPRPPRAASPAPCVSRRAFARALALGCAAALPVLHGCSGSSGSDSGSGTAADGNLASGTTFAFDTVVTFRAACDQAVLEQLDARCQYFESILSRTIDDSDVGRINAAQGAPVSVAPETADLVRKALDYCSASEGRFDITIGSVSSLWDFKEGIVPADADIQAALAHVDYRAVAVDGSTVQLLDPLAKIDLGGIAKGYIADDLCRMLQEAGCTSGFVNLGGNVKAIGSKPDGTPWKVGVQDPAGTSGNAVAAVDSTGSSIVTSGLYERAFEANGRRYWHILDTKTGYPVETELVSATIISPESIDGDGYTKPLFMMSPEEALAWIEAKPDLEAYLICADGSTLQTAGCAVEPL